MTSTRFCDFGRKWGWISFILCTSAWGQTASQVNFTLSLNNSVDPGLSYTNFSVGDTGTGSEYAIGFQIKINSVGGVAVNFDPVASFCSEVEESISTSSFTFTAAPLAGLAAGRAGQAGTASSGIPDGGIGALRAARLSYLFDQHYTSVALNGWTMSDAEPTLHAFQIAVWELTHDSDMSLSNTAGNLYVGAQASTRGNNALTLSQTYLNEVAAANITPSYTSPTFDFWALTSTTGNGAFGFQDVILATVKGSPMNEILTNLIVVPEGSTIWMMSLTGMGLLTTGLRRKRRRI